MTTVERPPLMRGIPGLTLSQLDDGTCPLGHVVLGESVVTGPEGGVFCPRCVNPDRRRKREANATECIHGHDITGPDSLTPDGKCRKCRQERAKVYQRRAKLRGYVKPVESSTTTPAPLVPASGTDGTRTKAYLQVRPPGKWVYEAACGPDTAFLFDKKQTGEHIEEAEARHRAARDLCEFCPVFNNCMLWYANEPGETQTVAALR